MPIKTGHATHTERSIRQGARAGEGRRQGRIRTLPLTLLTLGGIMGSGLFLASAQVLRLAGAGAVLAYLLGALVMAIELAALAEMAAADPARGSFLTYARRAIGPGVAFVGGWIFWFSSVLNLAAEATAAATLSRLWLHALPLWIPSVSAALLITGLNFLPLKGYDQVEAAMSSLKVGALAVFLVVAGLALGNVLPTHAKPGFAAFSPFLPAGLRGVAAAMAVVMFSMAGTGILGLAAAAVRRPRHTIPQSVLPSVVVVTLTYVLSALAILGLVHRKSLSTAKASPFVQALAALPFPWAPNLMNALLLLAILSAMNAGLFATDRVLASLARMGDAPHLLAPARRSRPLLANLVTGIALVLASALSYLLPKTAFLVLVTATSFQALFIWILIVATSIPYRRWLEEHRPGRLSFRLPLHPWLPWFEIVLIVGIIATAPLAPHELLSLGVAVAVTGAFALAYLPVRARRQG